MGICLGPLWRGVDKDLGKVSTVPMKDFVASTDEKE